MWGRVLKIDSVATKLIMQNNNIAIFKEKPAALAISNFILKIH